MLQGLRLLLRSVRREDIPLLCRFNNDLEVELSGGGDPPMPQSLERVLAEFDAGLARGGRDGTSFVIEADGKCIGQCALFQFDHVAHTCALGITIGDKGYWGRGYGREALQLLLHYGFVMHNLHKVWLTVNSNNERALRAYRACGFVEEGRLRQQVWSNGQYLDLVYMGVLRGEWARQNAERSGRLV